MKYHCDTKRFKFIGILLVCLLAVVNCDNKKEHVKQKTETVVEDSLNKVTDLIIRDSLDLLFYKKMVITDRLMNSIDSNTRRSAKYINNIKTKIGERYGGQEFPKIVDINDTAIIIINPFDRGFHLDFYEIDNNSIINSLQYSKEYNKDFYPSLYFSNLLDSLFSVELDYNDYELYQSYSSGNYEYWMVKNNKINKQYFFKYNNQNESCKILAITDCNLSEYNHDNIFNVKFQILDNLIIFTNIATSDLVLYDLRSGNGYCGKYPSNGLGFLNFTINKNILLFDRWDYQIKSFSTEGKMNRITQILSPVDFTNYSSYFFDRNTNKIYLSVFDFKEFALNIYVGDYVE